MGNMYGKNFIMEALRKKEIETLRVWTSDGYVEEDLHPEQSLMILKTMQCLAKLNNRKNNE